MKWQEYQEAVGELYRQMEQIGKVEKNITLPDLVTGQPRQIDVWWEIMGKGHKLGILIDAKLRKNVLDVKVVEEVLSLANAVGANKAVIVTNSGWTKPAERKAQFSGLDLRIFSIEEALELVVPEMWKMCPSCENDCIVMDQSNGFVVDGIVTLFLAGNCRECGSALIWCQGCGWKNILEIGEEEKCWCDDFLWGNDSNRGICLKFEDQQYFLAK
ncbi:restriction endonuclease [Brevibacillus brevis]|uniref:restriction endonuclease n=1 Tax=Brevibacillus brevis TaxID=1393 RepID=UPI000D0EE71B|nr:restriction endonuclease [Brevibacillus brevis]PSJ63538.1 hypothetical protein C7J99_31255 [Brevibacillus brevis]RED33856.1 restriction endonuclease [Brevibacillus brevis]GEC93347.1 hypothetical protein BBR01nite_56780 [Brevibacillus brevis]VEF92574.1 Restriction endonuclease [Brevibacillus brevis]